MTIEVESRSLENDLFVNHSVSSIGGRDENQDFCGMLMTPRGFLVVVSDGMGGMNGGAVASKVAVETILDYVSKPAQEDNLDSSNKLVLTRAVCLANEKILEEAAQDNSLTGMGCTVTVLLINEDIATVAYVGDSRIYQLRHGRKVFRTFDHSMVFELVKKKILTEEQARLSAQSNVILRALGQKSEVQVDVFDLPYDAGDIFLLCTDGIWGTMSEKELIRRVSIHKHPSVIMDKLARNINQNALAHGGGHDNLTAAMVVTTKNSTIRNKMERKLKIALAAALLLLIGCLIYIVIGLCSRQTAVKKGFKEAGIEMPRGTVEVTRDENDRDSTFIVKVK